MLYANEGNDYALLNENAVVEVNISGRHVKSPRRILNARADCHIRQLNDERNAHDDERDQDRTPEMTDNEHSNEAYRHGSHHECKRSGIPCPQHARVKTA